METKSHWFMGLVVAVLVIAAIVQGNLLRDVRQRVAKLETNMPSAGMSQQMMTPSSTSSESMPPSTNSMQTNPMNQPTQQQ